MTLTKYFKITSVHRDDLKCGGFDADRVTDEQMVELADRMKDAYVDAAFWRDLVDIADDMDLPRCEKDDAGSE